MRAIAQRANVTFNLEVALNRDHAITNVFVGELFASHAAGCGFAVVLATEHRPSHDLNTGLKRDHQHLKGRVRPMRHFKRLARANTFCRGHALIRFCRGHALIRNLRQGFSDLRACVSPRLRLATAWTVLTAAL